MIDRRCDTRRSLQSQGFPLHDIPIAKLEARGGHILSEANLCRYNGFLGKGDRSQHPQQLPLSPLGFPSGSLSLLHPRYPPNLVFDTHR